MPEEGPSFMGRRRHHERLIKEKEAALRAQVRSTLAYPSVQSLSVQEKVRAVETDPNVRAKAAQLDAAIRLADRHARQFYTHAESHTLPSHHVGRCDASCRAGERFHAHRRPRGSR